MHRNRTWQIDPEELRTQRNRILPIEGGDGSTLSLDFTGGVLDPRLTFTRASNATFINSSGLVQWAAANMMTRSQSQDVNGYWSAFSTAVTRTASQTDPFGGSGAVKLDYDATSADAVISRSVSVQQGLQYTISVWLRADSGTLNNVRFGRAAAATGAYFPSLTTTWQRFSLTFTATGSTDGIELRVLTSGTPQTASFHVFGAQLEPGDTMRNYNPALLDAPYHAPRFDYDPTTGAPRGLLVEGQVVNNVTNSDTLPTGTSWTANSLTRTNVSTVTPDGNTTTTTCGLSHTGSGSFRSAAVTVSANTAYTFSFWVKNNGGSVALYRAFNVSGSADIVSETSYFSQINSSTWTRIQFNFTTPVGCTSVYVYPLSQSSGTSNILVWGAQLEAGTSASSYFPAGASTATKNADKMSLLDITTMQWNQTAGTFALSMDVAAETNTTSFPAAWGMYTATPVRVIRNLINNSSGTNPRFFVDTWTSALTQIFSQSISRPTSPVLTKFAFALSNSGQAIAMCVNNGAITTGSGTGTMQTPTRLLFHQDPSATDAEYFPIHIRSFKYWPTSLSNDQLQSLTT